MLWVCKKGVVVRGQEFPTQRMRAAGFAIAKALCTNTSYNLVV